MPATANKSPVASRQQTIIGKPRVIDVANHSPPPATATPRQVREQIAANLAETEVAPSQFFYADAAPECPGHPGKSGPSIYVEPLSKLSTKLPFLFIAEPEGQPHKKGMASYLKKIANRLGIKVTVRTDFEYLTRTGMGIWYLGDMPKKG